MDEDIFLGVVSVDETVSRLDIEPLDGSTDLGGDDLLGWFLLDISVSCSLLLWWSLRVGHDVLDGRMVTYI